MYQPTSHPDVLWNGLQEGEVGLSEVAADRLGVEVGGTVELSTVHGPRNYQVAGVFRPHVINDTALGDIVLGVGAAGAIRLAAVRDQIDRELLLARRGDRPPR